MIKMSLEDFPKFVNDEDPELAIAKALFLSTRPNSHKFNLSEEVLQKYAPTILGKFLVGNLNVFESDVMSHERKPDIFGYIPTTQQVEFVRADDGYLDAYVNIVVSKIYATEVYSLFLDDNFRNVSVEMRVMYSDEETKDVAEFNIAGLTVLGKTVNPSVPRAHMEMVRFSADEAEKYYSEHVSCSERNFETEVLGKLNLVLNKLNLTNETVNNEEAEENMAKLEEQEKDVVMEQPTEEAPKEEETKETKLAEDAGKEEEKEEVKEEKASDDSESDKKDDEDKQEDEKASEDSDDKEEDDDDEEDDKLAEKEAQCAELEAKCAKLEAKLSELEKFKADTEEKEKMSIVNQTLAQVKESMDAEVYAKFEEKAKDYTLETVNSWRNEVLANVATVLMSAKKEESHLRIEVEDVKTPTKLWDRM